MPVENKTAGVKGKIILNFRRENGFLTAVGFQI